MRLVQLDGPNGPFYVDPKRVDAIGFVRQLSQVDERNVREIIVNGQCFSMFDIPKNMQAVLE